MDFALCIGEFSFCGRLQMIRGLLMNLGRLILLVNQIFVCIVPVSHCRGLKLNDVELISWFVGT